MNESTAAVVRQRARVLGILAVRSLHEDPDDEASGELLRFTFLVTRGPRAFLERFGPSNSLTIDLNLVADGLWQFRNDLPAGPEEIMTEEIDIIEDHNLAAEEFISVQRRG